MYACLLRSFASIAGLPSRVVRRSRLVVVSAIGVLVAIVAPVVTPLVGPSAAASASPPGSPSAAASAAIEDEAAGPPPEGPRTATVYACRAGGQAIYADRPCAQATGPATLSADARAGARTFTVPASNGVAKLRRAAGAHDATKPRGHPARRRASATGNAAGVPAPDSARCRRLRASLERLDSKMRAGYASREGEKLRALRRTARAAHRAEGCRWNPGLP